MSSESKPESSNPDLAMSAPAIYQQPTNELRFVVRSMMRNVVIGETIESICVGTDRILQQKFIVQDGESIGHEIPPDMNRNWGFFGDKYVYVKPEWRDVPTVEEMP